MIETTSRVLRTLAILIAVVGAVDAVRGEHWDQVAMLVVIAALLVVDLALGRLGPPTLAVRPDHLDWLEEEAARTDDTPALVAGRAVAAYRATRGSPNASGASS